MKERELAGIFKKSCAKQGMMYVDIPDSMGNVGTPCDGVLNFDGNFVAIEFKRSIGYKAFSPDQLSEGQKRGLDACVESGGISLVGLFVWEKHKFSRLIFWEWEDFKMKTDNLSSSILKKELETLKYIECVKKHYDLKGFKTSLDSLINKR